MHPLPFPAGKPDAYIRLRGEPPFNPARHLALQKPARALSLQDLGYDKKTIAQSPSPVAITEPFRIFSEEGLAVARDVAAQMKSNRNEAAGTGKNRLGSYIRGAGYRSQFIRDFCECPQLLDFLSAIVAAPLASHTVPAVACGINYAPEDVSRAVDTWHVDSVSFDAVILLTDPATFRGGEFQYFRGTKEEGESLLGARAEEGAGGELPQERVISAVFPAAGYGFLQQGNMVFHRACRLLQRAERTTMIPSFVALDAARDKTNVRAMSRWNDPGILCELARHEAWIARERLRKLTEDIPLSASPAQIAEAAEDAVAGLHNFAGELRRKG